MTKLIKSGIFIFAVLVVSLPAAQAQEGKALTLEECIQIALKNNSQLRNAQRQVRRAQTDVVSARANWLPRINTSFSAGKTIMGARVDLTDVPVGIDPETGNTIFEQQRIYQESTERNSHRASLSANQNIYDFGRTLYGIKEAAALKEATEFSLVDTRMSVIVNVKNAYYNLIKAKRLEEVYAEAVALAQDQINRTQTMMDIGLASQAEVFQARVTLGRNKTDLITQRNNVEIARADLNNALGQNPSTLIDVIEDEIKPIFPAYTFEEAVETALKNNQALKAREQEVRANLYAVKGAKGRYFPTLGAGFNYSRSNEDISRVYTTDLDLDYVISVGVSADLNIFNGFADKAAVQRQTINHQIAVEDLAENKRLLIVSVKQYFLELAAYKEIVEINEQNIEAAQENLRLQTEKRNVGSGTELEVTQAQVELTQAQAGYVNAEYDAKISRARLEAEMGIEE
jgi:outer membrane protein